LAIQPHPSENQSLFVRCRKSAQVNVAPDSVLRPSRDLLAATILFSTLGPWLRTPGIPCFEILDMQTLQVLLKGLSNQSDRFRFSPQSEELAKVLSCP